MVMALTEGLQIEICHLLSHLHQQNQNYVNYVTMLIEQNNNLCPTLRANHDEKTCNPPCICTKKSRFGLHIKKMLMLSVEH